MALGIDVYRKFQNVTDWAAVRRSGVGFCWVKLTDGGGVASAGPGDREVAGARGAGVAVGGYHYAQLSPSPEAQADLFIREVRRTGALGCVPMLDLEAPFGPDAAAADFARRFLRRVASLGFRPGIYLNNAFAKAVRPDQWPENPAVWIARYGARPDAAAGHYDVHQYSSSGLVPGITASAVDMNESYTSAHLIGAPAGGTQQKTEELFMKDADYYPFNGERTTPDADGWSWQTETIPLFNGPGWGISETYVAVTGGDTPGWAAEIRCHAGGSKDLAVDWASSKGDDGRFLQNVGGMREYDTFYWGIPLDAKAITIRVKTKAGDSPAFAIRQTQAS